MPIFTKTEAERSRLERLLFKAFIYIAGLFSGYFWAMVAFKLPPFD